MKKAILPFILLILSIYSLYGQKAKVVVLGVGHSSQLVNYHQQPAAIRAFIAKVDPVSICIERSPEEFSKNDFYEFTYEQQYLIVPFAKQLNKRLYPIDWLPSEAEMDLAFGLKDLEKPRFVRQKSGFLGFTTFAQASELEEGLYFADQQKFADSIASWYGTYPKTTAFDFPRRLFLYRTFLQSKRIQKVLEGHGPSDTVLVVIGAFHKNDIERNLEQNGYQVIQPSSFGPVSDQEIRNNFRREDACAVLAFNLLGMQAELDGTNSRLVDTALKFLVGDPSVEAAFFRARHSVLTGRMSPAQAVDSYGKLLARADKEVFTWNGVRDGSRVDSYFDPFGNLPPAKRIRLEMAREYRKWSKESEAGKHIGLVLDGLGDYKKSMLEVYLGKYLH